MENKYVWKVEDIYANDKAWEEDFNRVNSFDSFSSYKGKLADKKELMEFIKEDEKVSRVIEKLSVYAMMNHDKDTRNSVYDCMRSKISSLCVEFSAKCSFVVPELTSLSEEKLNEYISDPDLRDYSYFFKGILKKKKHVLTENEEKILAMSTEVSSSFREIFTKIDNADLPLASFTYKGQKYELTHGTYSVLLHGEDRALRKKAYHEYYKAYISLINSISSTYYGSVKKDVFYAKVKNYDSALDMALASEDVPKKVYENLIASVHRALPILHRYIKEKKKALNLKTMYMYDMYCPIVEDAEIKLSYDKAYEVVKEGLSVLGGDYVKLLERAYNDRWIDVYETPGKRSGAYSVAVYDAHPYVLLNYQKTTHDIFTIAHEMGHSIHSYFSNKTQPYVTADYKIFVAEVASTVNEVLLIKHLLKVNEDKKVKKYLLSYLLEMIRTTLFRQTQFAEFESFTHSSVEKGEPLTKDTMCEKYLALNEKYYGKAVKSDDIIKYEWARIPHFYRAFYVYKYATGIISALSIAERILTEGQPAIDDYFRFLSSGGSDAPNELLKIAGVDLTEEKTFARAFKVFEEALTEFCRV